MTNRPPPEPPGEPGGNRVDPMLEVRERSVGARPGDAYVRIVRPFESEFEHGDEGQLIASERTIDSTTTFGRWFRGGRNFLFGRPISSEHEEHERLTKIKALAVFSSDNISSSAYATEEIMRILILAGVGAIALTLPITVAIVAVLVIVAVSYRQTIRAYPNGASSYIVASDNLGTGAGLLAGGALLIDYTLTVAVSVSAGVAAITSLVPSLYPERVLIALIIVALLTIGNLRGIRESGTIFMAPTYLYLVVIFGVIVWGLFLQASGNLGTFVPPPEWMEAPAGTATVLSRIPRSARVQLRIGRADRGRGGFRWGPGFQAPGMAQCANDADMGGNPVRCPVPGHQLPGGNHPGRPRSHRTANRLVPDHTTGGRRRVVSGRRPDRNRPGPHPGRQHRLRGLPTPVVLPGSRRIHAPPVRLPRRPAGVHDRHRCPGRHGQRPPGRL